MSRLAVDIDPIAIIRNVFTNDVPDPAHIIVLAELGGAESIVCHLRDDLKSVNDRDVHVLKEVVKTHFNVRCNVGDENVRKLLKINPDMITFVASDEKSTLTPKPLIIDDYLDSISNYIADLRANNIATSVFIEPDIDQIKQAGKIEFDYVELNTSFYASAEDLDQQIAELENINSLVLAANKLGMGVNVSGGLSQDNLNDISKIPYLDDLIIGSSIAVKALSIGFEQAVRDFVSII